MAGPGASNWFRRTLILDPWKRTGTALDIDAGNLKIAFFSGASMSPATSAGFNFDTDTSYGVAPWSVGEYLTTGTGGWSSPGGILLSAILPTPPTVAVTTASGSTALTLSPFTIGPGPVTTGSVTSFDHILLYDTTASQSPASPALCCWYLGTTPLAFTTSSVVYTFDFADTPQTNNALYAS